MSIPKLPAEVFHPSEYIQDELLARGWTTKQFAIMARLHQAEAERLANGDLGVTPRLALRLSQAFGTSAAIWYRMQRSFDAGPAPRK